MAVNDPRAGRAFVWLVASFLFVSICLGGGCLITYMSLPATSSASSLLLVAGIVLVCLPWLFWFLTFAYRVISRVLGLRIGPDGRDQGGESKRAGSVDRGENVVGDTMPSVGSSGHEESDRKAGRSSSKSSTASHESEMPLALSMAS